nr:O-antigen ligase family protein [Pelotalea chapellei]
MLLSLYVIPKTGSRGGLLALVAVVLAVLIKKGWRRFFQGAIVAVTVGGIFYYAAGDQLERLMTVSDLDTDYNQTAQEGRVQIWQRTSKMIVQHPLFGSGVGAFITAEGQTHEGGKWSAAHNSFIQIGVELGVIGLLAHLWVIWKMIVLARKNPDKYSFGIEVAMYAYVVGGMFLSWAFAYLFYFFLGLSLAKSRINNAQVVATGSA